GGTDTVRASKGPRHTHRSCHCFPEAEMTTSLPLRDTARAAYSCMRCRSSTATRRSGPNGSRRCCKSRPAAYLPSERCPLGIDGRRVIRRHGETAEWYFRSEE